MQSYGSSGGNKSASYKSASYKRANSQALKLQAASLQALSQRLKLQARVHKLQNLRARVQAHKPTLRGASNKDKGILCMFNVESYLVG